MKKAARLLASAALLAVSVSASAKAGASIAEKLTVNDGRRKPISLGKLLPNKRTVLLVIDPNASSSHEFLNDLRATGYDGHGAMVLELASEDPNAMAGTLVERLPGAEWVSGSMRESLESLRLSGTPAIYGLDDRHEISWRRMARSGEADTLALRILNWVLAAEPSTVTIAGGKKS